LVSECFDELFYGFCEFLETVGIFELVSGCHVAGSCRIGVFLVAEYCGVIEIEPSNWEVLISLEIAFVYAELVPCDVGGYPLFM